EPDVVVTVRRWTSAAERRAANQVVAAPTPAAQDPAHVADRAVGAGWVLAGTLPVVVLAVPILAPFPDVAVHVIQRERIVRVRPEGAGVARVGPRVWSGGCLGGGGVPEVKGKGLEAPAATGVFPLGLRWQAVCSPHRLPFIERAKERQGLVMGYFLDR